MLVMDSCRLPITVSMMAFKRPPLGPPSACFSSFRWFCRTLQHCGSDRLGVYYMGRWKTASQH